MSEPQNGPEAACPARSDPRIQPDLDDQRFAQAAAAYEQGIACEEAGDREGAIAAYGVTLALDPADRAGIALRLARLGAGPMPDRAPRAYVQMLFDEAADAFDARLVEDLGYRVPEEMRRRLDPLLPPGRSARALDLGCGTGLVGLHMAERVAEMTGIDLSVGMLVHAWRRGVYAGLLVGDVVEVLRARRAEGAPPVDLILAADLLIYIGDAGPLLRAASACLSPGGLIAVSTECGGLTDLPDASYALGDGVRYSHAPAYLCRSMEAAGLSPLSLDPIIVRTEGGRPVPGHLTIARRIA